VKNLDILVGICITVALIAIGLPWYVIVGGGLLLMAVGRVMTRAATPADEQADVSACVNPSHQNSGPGSRE
jgi:hypothetical protein